MTRDAGMTRKHPPAGAPDPRENADAALRPAPRVTGLDLSPLGSSVPSFRLHARAVMHEWGMGAIADETELVVSELATNAVRAAAAVTAPGGPRPVRLRLTERARGVHVEIWDASEDMPRPGPDVPHDHPGGRGLLIVASLAERHGAHHTAGGGKCTWAILAMPNAAPDTRQEEASHHA